MARDGYDRDVSGIRTEIDLRYERVFGLEFVAGSDVGRVADQLMDRRHGDSDDWAVVVTPNVDHLVRYESNHDERAVAESAALVLPDGAPIVWVSTMAGVPLRSRVTGSGLFCEWWPRVAKEQCPVVAVVAGDEVGRRLQRENPATTVIVPPVFELDDHDTIEQITEQIIDSTVATGAMFVVLGISMPKHHRLARRLSERRLPPGSRYPAVLLLGASAEFYTGTRRRAPKILQQLGLEWVHRLVGDPRRMARRYLVDDMRFIPIAAREVRRRRTAAA